MKKLFFSLFILLSGILTVSAQGEAPEGLFINSRAYDFKGKDQHGKEIRLKDLLKSQKNVVLVFYLGQWSPTCSKYLHTLQDSLKFIEEKGATVVAVTPELPDNILKTAEKSTAEFSILYDENLKIMKAYDVDYEVPENTLKRYGNTGINLVENDGAKNGNVLPIPATYIIDKDFAITYRFFSTDIKKRPSVKEILDNLK
jgi:peroxiredoxin